MAGNNGNKLVDKFGQTLIKEPSLLVIKHPVNRPLPQGFVEQLSKLTKSVVIELPLYAEILDGTIAKKDLELIRGLIDKVLETL